MAESMLEETIRYLDFREDDQLALQQIYPLARNHFAEIAEIFYDRIRAHPSAHAVFRGSDQVDRLKLTLQNWLASVLTGPWDEAYFALRARIGRIHVEVRLPQFYMLTAMNMIHQQLDEIASSALASDPPALAQARSALRKVLNLDLAIMLESYRADTLAQVERSERVEREILQKQLELSEERYRIVIETAQVLVITVSRDGSVQLFNRMSENHSGYTRVEVVGRSFVELLCHPQDRDTLEAIMQTAREQGVPQRIETRLVRRDGELRWIQWQWTPLHVSAGASLGAIGTDITDERLARERTRKQEHLASLGTLAAGLAHEIRNPLNAAQLQLSVMKRRLQRAGQASSEALEPARIVHEELLRLGGLVEDFLAFARPTRLRISTGNIQDTVASVVALVQPDASRVGVTIATDRTTAVTARYDEERIRQVLLNLIRNGIEAAGPGGSVHVRARKTTLCVIEVCDSGPGFPANLDIFEPFATTKTSGTGLGLPIVQRIVTDHGGSIEVRRQEGLTTFRVLLPLDGPVDPVIPASTRMPSVPDSTQ